MKYSARILSVLLLWVVAFGASPAFASHLRGISLTYQPTSTPGTVQFTFLYSYRASSGCNEHQPCEVGDTVDTEIDTGDGNYEYPTATVTSVNSADDYMISVAVFTHTYTGTGPYTAQYNDCCRLSNLKSGASGDIVLSTTVSPFSTNHPPVASMPAILGVPLTATPSFQLIASDPDNNTLHYRLGTAEETFGLSSYDCGNEPPPGLSVSQSGVVTWDTSQIAASSCSYGTPQLGDLWPVHFMVEDVDSNNNVLSSVSVDLILKFVDGTNPAPTLAFDQTSPLTVAPGSTISFNATANDSATNARVSITVAGQPANATVTNLNQLLSPPLVSNFSWTPTLADAGTYVVAYTVTNDTFQQTLGSMTITVPSVQPPTLSCPASVTGQYGSPVSIPLTVTDSQGHAVTVVWTLDGNVVQTDNVAASSSANNLSYSNTLSVGSHVLSIAATNTDNLTSTCTPPVTISKADQTITFAALSNVNYGDTDVALSALASSGLGVTFSASGSCSIINGSIHANGAGSCSVTASQAGNGNYNAAVDVTRSFTIGQRVLTVTAANATRAYGVANPTFTGTLTGVVTGDNITASYATTATTTSPIGTYSILPTLTGDLSNYSVTSNNGTLTVTKTTPVLSWAPPASINYGTNLSSVLTATASANSVAVPGVFTYTTSTGTVVSSAVLPAGSYTLNITFVPTDTTNYNNATGSASLAVNKINPAGVAPSTSSSVVLLKNNVTFTAGVSSTVSTPTGSITFMNGSTVLATVPLTNGTATYTLNSLAAATYSITAVYSGDNNFNALTSSPVTETVIDFTFNLTASATNSTTQIIYPGQTATYVLTLAPNSPATTFPSAVNLSVSGLPAGATYTLSPTTIATGAGTTTATLTVTVPNSYAKNDTLNPSKTAAIALALLLLPFSGRMRRSGKRFGRLLTLLLFIAAGAIATTGLTGCGTASGLYGHGEQTSSLTVTGTSGNLSHSVNLTLKVE
ncbi:Ig-like domain repeat protein [Terriglobus tenax]|uniref:Ig-like domain repeat protein n=1 Tax=Terriglobus tenax TaxID=1111115 RepID=UPI0021E048D0|nr:Ig-like domain repeat protein [Terriglobus tenax]